MYPIIAFMVLLLDQGSKWIIMKKLQLHEQVSVIGNFFLLTSDRNRGAAFGILENQRWFLITIPFAVVIGIVWYMYKIRHQRGFLLPLGLSLILGGAVGNFVDRLFKGEVVDFLQFNFGSYTFPIFNIADAGICIGVGLVLLDAFVTVRRERRADLTDRP